MKRSLLLKKIITLLLGGCDENFWKNDDYLVLGERIENYPLQDLSNGNIFEFYSLIIIIINKSV